MTARVVVAVPTYKRPQMLRAALTEITQQIRETATSCGADVEILVIDNDPLGTAKAFAQTAGARYVIEPAPGLSAVRNRALDESHAHDLLLFLDDDEVPEPGWLAAMLRMQRETGADAVAGYVTTLLPQSADAWIQAGYTRPVRAHGESMSAAATNNLLLDLRTVRRLGLRFEASLGLVGGEDTLFTSQLTRGGGTIRWAQDAHVIETVDPQRLDRRWILMRAYRAGNTQALTSRLLRSPGPDRVLGRIGDTAGGAARFVVGSAQAGVGLLLRDTPVRVAGLRRAWRGAGFVAGAVGRPYDEYARRRAQPPVTSSPPIELSPVTHGESQEEPPEPIKSEDIGVVVVNYGTHALVERNLRASLGRESPVCAFVVDSWSSDDERKAMSELCARNGWRLVAPEHNPGFGGGCNLGARAALDHGARVIVMLNPDAQMTPDDLTALASKTQANPDALVAPLVVRPDGRRYSAATDLHLATGKMRARDKRPASTSHDAVFTWASGACFAMSAELWERVGGFDEDYFLYWEDVDLCRRVIATGGTVVVDESLRAVHDEGATHGRSPNDRVKSPLYYYYNIRNRLLFAERHLSGAQRWRWVLSAPKVAYMVLLQGGRRQLIHPTRTWLPAVRGLSDGIRGRTGDTFHRL